MSLYIHCDHCDAKRLVSPGVIAPPHWKVYGERGKTFGQEFTLCPECETGLQRWLRQEPDLMGSTSGLVTIDGVTLVNPVYKAAGSAFRPPDSEQARVLVTFEVDADWGDDE